MAGSPAEGPTGSLAASSVAIVGLGLLGGSLGRALARMCARRIGVVAPGDSETARRALQLGVVDDVMPLREAVERADVVVLAAPVRAVVAMLPDVAAAARAGALITDVGGSKVAVVEAMGAARSHAAAGVQFVGGHPMCGGTTPGLSASDPGLFAGARWALCQVPEPEGGDGGEQVDAGVTRASALAAAVGAVPVVCGAAEHDRAVALISHAPRVVAQVLAQALAARDAADHELASALAGRGWSGATRLARGDAAMWGDVLVTNATEVAAVARELARRLDGVADELDADVSR